MCAGVIGFRVYGLEFGRAEVQMIEGFQRPASARQRVHPGILHGFCLRRRPSDGANFPGRRPIRCKRRLRALRFIASGQGVWS